MNSQRIIVARIFDTYDGRASSRVGVITRLNPEKFETICVYLVRASHKENYFEEAGYKTFYLSDQKISSLSAKCIYRLSEILKQNKVDIVHCHRHKATVIGTMAAILARTSVVVTQVHGLDRTRNFRRKLLNYFLFKRIAKIITVGEAVRKDVLKNNPGLPECKVVSEGNSIDCKPFISIAVSKEQARINLSLPADAFVYGTVGRLAPTKGQTYLIKAFAQTKRKIPAAYLIFAGEGRLLDELKAVAEKADLADSVRFLGRRSDIPQIFRAMDVFVLPSVAEGMPRALLEAMAAGVPSIASSVGAIEEIIDDGQSGILVPCQDEASLADAMTKIASLPPQQRETMIMAARDKVLSCFTHEIVSKRLEKMYEEEITRQVNKPECR